MVPRSWVDAARSFSVLATELPMSRRFLSLSIVILLVVTVWPFLVKGDSPKGGLDIGGTIPPDARGRPLNLRFATGSLDDWTAEGDAFKGQPIKGDAVHSRRDDMYSRHVGNYWV